MTTIRQRLPDDAERFARTIAEQGTEHGTERGTRRTRRRSADAARQQPRLTLSGLSSCWPRLKTGLAPSPRLTCRAWLWPA